MPERTAADGEVDDVRDPCGAMSSRAPRRKRAAPRTHRWSPMSQSVDPAVPPPYRPFARRPPGALSLCRGGGVALERLPLVEVPVDRREWLEVLARDPDALVSQSPAWIEAVTRTGPWRNAARM